MSRIRHCIECPKCLTRYLVSFSRYENGSHLVKTAYGSTEEYALYCACRGAALATRYKGSEIKRFELSAEAYRRGFGTPEEITAIRDQPKDRWSFETSRYVNFWKALEKRKPSL